MKMGVQVTEIHFYMDGFAQTCFDTEAKQNLQMAYYSK